MDIIYSPDFQLFCRKYHNNMASMREIRAILFSPDSSTRRRCTVCGIDAVAVHSGMHM